MPWFPDFARCRRRSRASRRTTPGQADPAAQYFDALEHGDLDALEAVWPGQVVVYDPRAGEVRGHRHLREFVRHNQSGWPSGTPASRPSRRPARPAGPFSSCSLIWPATTDESPGRSRSSPSPPTSARSSSVRTAASGPSTAAPPPSVHPALGCRVAGNALRVRESARARRLRRGRRGVRSDGYYRESIGAHDLHRGAERAASVLRKDLPGRWRDRSSAACRHRRGVAMRDRVRLRQLGWSRAAAAGRALRRRQRGPMDCWPRSACTTTSNHLSRRSGLRGPSRVEAEDSTSVGAWWPRHAAEEPVSWT